ncbi:Hypothetical predicted protein [Xyrichtys novacula]|uniref:Uncharacterized protein n=1 Tax=Xyrichtys novacula TaxID=13765 RepID=A0AAV1G659_XYRNO|nr:Hypothetical predicted protein [Xyrichtys novacula]
MLCLRRLQLDTEVSSGLQPGQCAVAPKCNQLILTAGYTNASRQEAVVGSRRVSSGFSWRANITPPPPNLSPSKGRCCSSGLWLHDEIYSAAPFGWFGGMLWVRPLPSVGQWSEEGYQSSVEEGAGRGQEGAERVMSHWAE